MVLAGARQDMLAGGALLHVHLSGAGQLEALNDIMTQNRCDLLMLNHLERGGQEG